MKKVFLPLTALLLAFYSCNNALQQNSDNASDTSKISIPEPKDDAPAADASVDWNKPLYSIDTETGDTITKWLYTDTSIVETSIYTEASYGYEGEETKIYDLKGRIISECGSINSGNIHNDEMEYTYEGKIRTGKGSNITEGYPSFTEVKEVTYFADSDFKQDTLGQNYSAEVSWDDMDESSETPLELESYYVNKFANGKLVQTTYYGKDSETGKMTFRSRTVYDYNTSGDLVKSTLLNEQGSPLGEYAETRYTYNGNARTSSNDGSESVTYYAKK